MLFADGTGYDTLIVALVNIIVGAILAYFLKRLGAGHKDATVAAQVSADAVAATAQQVKVDLKTHTDAQNEKMENLAEVTQSTHSLVNSAMGVQLDEKAKAREALVEALPTPENILAAQAARAEYRAHMAKQAALDQATATGRVAVADAKKANDSNTMGS